MFIEYTAKRSLRTGTTVNTTQSFEIDIQGDDRKPVVESKTVKSLSGNQQTVFHRMEVTRAITLIPTKVEAVQDQIVEFLDSVVDGSSFSIDIYGTQASPDNPQTAVLSPLSYSAPARIQRLFLQFSFSIRLL